MTADLHVIPRDAEETGNLVKDDPAEAARRATKAREQTRSERLDETRQALESGAKDIAERLMKVARGEEKADIVQMQAMQSVLDRTVGKTSQVDMNVTSADQATDIVKVLTEREAK